MICFALSPLQRHAFSLYFSKMFCQSFNTPGFECITFKKKKIPGNRISLLVHTRRFQNTKSYGQEEKHQSMLAPCRLLTDLLVVLLLIVYTFYSVRFASGCPSAQLGVCIILCLVKFSIQSWWLILEMYGLAAMQSILAAHAEISHMASTSRIILKDTPFHWQTYKKRLLKITTHSKWKIYM